MKRYSMNELQKGYAAKEFSPVEITEQYLQGIEKNNASYNAYITVTREVALQQAKAAEQKMMAGHSLGKLFGIPLSFKDNIATKDIRTTNGSYIDRDHVPQQHAPVVEQVLGEDAIMLGKNNLHEYAFGITSNNPHYGCVKNPWSLEYSSGGSSGGSAAAVAANLCVASFGTDTGGSVRIPAANCGVVGLKPTIHKLSTAGVTEVSWSLDHVGPLTANMMDLSIIMEALTKQPYQQECQEDIRGLRIGVPTQYFVEQIDAESHACFQASVKALETMGACLIEVPFPFLQGYQDFGFAIALSETSYIQQENIRNRMSLFGADLQKVMASTGSFSALDYITALKKKQELERQFTKIFEYVDVLATPAIPTTPKKIGVEEVHFGARTEGLFDSLTRYAFICNLVGCPALSVPCGMTEEGLPLGLQLVAAHHREDLLMRVGYAFEQSQLSAFYQKRDEICIMQLT